MRTCLCLLLLAVAASAATGEAIKQRYWQRNQLVNQARERHEYDKALAVLAEMRGDSEFQNLYELRLNTEYNLACIYALAGRKAEALDTFESAVKIGLSAYDHVRRDTDLDSIREEPRFKAALFTVRRRALFWDDPAIAVPYREGDTISEDLRLAGLAKLWAEVKHNFAWFEHVPDLNWDAAYVAAIPKVRQSKTVADYYSVLQELAAMLKDAHTNVDAPWEVAQNSRYTAAIQTRLIGENVVVVEAGQSGPRPGSEIVAVEGVPVRQHAERDIRPYVSASTPQGLDQSVYGTRLLAGAKDSAVEVTVRDESGAESRIKLARTRNMYESGRPLTEFKLLAGNIGYFAINSFNEGKVVAQFTERFAEIARTGALIIDVRHNGGGNSGFGDQIIAYLLDKPAARQQCRTRLMRSANRAWGNNQDWSEDAAFPISPNAEKQYSKPVAVLTSAVSCSAAEDFLVVLDGAKRVTIVGEPSCGSTGQPLFIGLPGGGAARICTRNCRYADGREFNGVGVQPHVRVSPTIADLRAGRDTVLEAAVDRLRKR